MDSLEVRLARESDAYGGYWVGVHLLVNGRDLIDLVGQHEREHGYRPAGSYAAISVNGLASAHSRLTGDPTDWPGDGLSVLLVCADDREEGCWPMLARVLISEDVVEWRDFEQPHRPDQDYSALRFVFSRSDYDAEVQRVLASTVSREPVGTGVSLGDQAVALDRRKIVVGGALLAMFTLLGLGMIASGEPTARLWGLVSVVFFGGGGLLWSWAIWRGRLRVATDSDGIHLGFGLMGAIPAFVPWRDIGAFKVVRGFGQTYVGIVLVSYTAYLESIPEERSQALVRWLRRARWLGYVLAVVAVTQLNNPADLVRISRGIGRSRSLAELLGSTRQLFGADILIPLSQLSSSAGMLAERLEDLRHAAVEGQASGVT